MFKYLVLLFLIKSINSSHQPVNYKYEDYKDDGATFDKTHDTFSKILNDTELEDVFYPIANVIDDSIDVSVNDVAKEALHEQAKIPQLNTNEQQHNVQNKRECNYNVSEEKNIETPIPDAKDGISTYPFVATVLRMGAHYASGALVDRRWVITAGGVFYNVRESIKLYRVRLGSVNCKKGGQLMALQQIAIYPFYSQGKPEHDLAMLRLAEPVELGSHIHPISFTERKGRVDHGKFLTMYWPRMIVDGKAVPVEAKERSQFANLRVSTQRVIPWKTCYTSLLIRQATLTLDSFCLRPLRQHHSICLPDVGAPVVSQDGLWGIVSGWIGESCTFTDPSPVVVGRVSPPEVRFWIDSLMEHED